MKPITVAPGQFLLKDIGLFAASFWIFVDSPRPYSRGERRPAPSGKARRAPPKSSVLLQNPPRA